MMVAGDYAIEIVGKGDAASAFVFDANGKTMGGADIDLSLSAGNGAFVKLVWDAPSLSYRADIGGKIDIANAPLRVALNADGKAFTGASLPSVALDANANAKLTGNLDAKAHARADLHAAANVKPPHVAATAVVTPPKIEVHKSASAGGGAGASAKAGAGFSFGTP